MQKHKHMVKAIAKITLAGLAFASLQACSPAQKSSASAQFVAQAYETSGIIEVKPYTRTIFSSNNF